MTSGSPSITKEASPENNRAEVPTGKEDIKGLRVSDPVLSSDQYAQRAYELGLQAYNRERHEQAHDWRRFKDLAGLTLWTATACGAVILTLAPTCARDTALASVFSWIGVGFGSVALVCLIAVVHRLAMVFQGDDFSSPDPVDLRRALSVGGEEWGSRTIVEAGQQLFQDAEENRTVNGNRSCELAGARVSYLWSLGFLIVGGLFMLLKAFC